MRGDDLHIVYATDSQYLFPTQVAAASAIVRASDPSRLFIHILDCGLRDPEWDEFSSGIRKRNPHKGFGLERHKIDVGKYENRKAWHGSLGLYARFEIPEVLDMAKWSVYCDGDTLFTDDPFKLMPYFDDRYLLLGHADWVSGQQREWHQTHGLRWNEGRRICSGFLIMNLERFRQEKIVEKLWRFLDDYPDAVFPDQDALNYVCLEGIGLLPDEWGQFAFLAKKDSRPGCFHYASVRPWELNERSRLAIPSCSALWFDTLFTCVGWFPWKCRKSFWRYLMMRIGTAFWSSVYRGLNLIPGLRGRYDGVEDVVWSRKTLAAFKLM